MVSLGSDCEIAHQLRRHKISKAYYPLDWVRSEDCDKVCELLDRNFVSFLDAHSLKEVGVNNVDKPPRKVISNESYKILFVHDFHMNKDKSDAQVVQKYARRIARFRMTVASKNQVYFFRKGITKAQAERIKAIIEKKWPQLNYTLVALGESEEFKNDWNMFRVRNFFLRNIEWPPAHGWEENNARWDEIFKQLKLA